MRIAILTDIHYSSCEERTCNVRETGAAHILLQRAVSRLNRLILPDVTILAGDLVNRGDSEYGPHDMQVIAEQLKLLQSQIIVIPGNHDGPAEKFYKFFPEPERIMELEGVRFVVNWEDEERPGYNAWRSPCNIDLIRQARCGFSGPVITLQHTPCFPAGTNNCPYNYINSAEINAAESANDVLLSISGHHHEGIKPYQAGKVTFFTAPALCEAPFRISCADINVMTGEMEWFSDRVPFPGRQLPR